MERGVFVDNEMSVGEANRIVEQAGLVPNGWESIATAADDLYGSSEPCDACEDFTDPFFDESESVEWSDNEMPSSTYPTADDFPVHVLPKWDMNERDSVANIWSRQMDYRLRWIFYREEREGVNRTRYINPFSPDDFKTRIEKTSEPHPANTPTSTFYDWKIGGAEFLMRLERLHIKDEECLRCHFIHKSSGKEICYQDRVWDGQTYNEVNITWADSILP
jgi:hypothetical protein